MVISMTRSLCEKASAGTGDRGRATAPTALVVSHRGHCERLDEYQYNVADFGPVRPLNFAKIAWPASTQGFLKGRNPLFDSAFVASS
jgi:hypothetical protein